MRLAPQGLLTQPSLNFAQIWGLQYWLYMDRREKLDDVKATLELQTYNLAYERWEQLYKSSGAAGDLGNAFEGEPELPVTDPADLDEWYEHMNQPRRMTGAQAMGGTLNGGGSSVLGYAEGPGRRV